MKSDRICPSYRHGGQIFNLWKLVGDRFILLQHGKMIDQGTPDELIERTVGREVAEIEGINEQILEQRAYQAGTWYRPFGSSYLIGLQRQQLTKNKFF